MGFVSEHARDPLTPTRGRPVVVRRQMRLDRHLARTPARSPRRIARRLLALTRGVFLNASTGRPARALAANDRRCSA
jgi:hypothetical protein